MKVQDNSLGILERLYGPYKETILRLGAADIHWEIMDAVNRLRAQGCLARMDTLETIWRHWQREKFTRARNEKSDKSK